MQLLEQPDKALHALGGAVIGAAVAVASGSLPLGAWVAFGVAWAKERYDKAHPDRHTFDGWDAYATALGGLLGAHLGDVCRAHMLL